MTYSITAKCPRTGQYGVAVSTYSPRVGATVPLVVPNRGAVAFQSVVSPDFRQMAADLIATGASADGVLKELEQVFGLTGADVLRYADRRRGQSRGALFGNHPREPRGPRRHRPHCGECPSA